MTIARSALFCALALLLSAAGAPEEDGAAARRDAGRAVATHLSLIPWVRDELAQRGMTLVVRLVPAAGSGDRRARPGLYEDAHRALSAAGIVTTVGAPHAAPAGTARLPILLIGAADSETDPRQVADRPPALPDNLLRYSAPGAGPFLPMLDYLLHGPELPLQPRVVIWEIGEDALMQPQDLRVERRTVECEPAGAGRQSV
jgi:hypothetical protein